MDNEPLRYKTYTFGSDESKQLRAEFTGILYPSARIAGLADKEPRCQAYQKRRREISPQFGGVLGYFGFF